uniref:Uncharacterized protein n=1 Tax=Salmo trutta TaxID=8032 RepID=A0A673YNV7_SALTR
MKSPPRQPLRTLLWGIYIIKDHVASEEPEDTGFVLEVVKVLQDLGNVAFAVAMLFSLMYAMNLSYPTELRYTIKLNGDNLSNKAVTFKKEAVSDCMLKICVYLTCFIYVEPMYTF